MTFKDLAFWPLRLMTSSCNRTLNPYTNKYEYKVHWDLLTFSVVASWAIFAGCIYMMYWMFIGMYYMMKYMIIYMFVWPTKKIIQVVKDAKAKKAAAAETAAAEPAPAETSAEKSEN